MVHAEAGKTKVVKELISQGAPLDAQDQVTTSLYLHCHCHLSMYQPADLCMTKLWKTETTFGYSYWTISSWFASAYLWICLQIFVQQMNLWKQFLRTSLILFPPIIPTPFLLTCTHMLTHTLHSQHVILEWNDCPHASCSTWSLGSCKSTCGKWFNPGYQMQGRFFLHNWCYTNMYYILKWSCY